MCAFVDDNIAHTTETVEDDSASTALDIVDGGAGEGEGEGGGDGDAVERTEGIGRHRGYL